MTGVKQYTPMSRADFAAVGIIKHCEQCGFDTSPVCSACQNPDVTGVLCNREPATTQAEVEAAVEWLGRAVAYCTVCHRYCGEADSCHRSGSGGMASPNQRAKIHTRLLHISPREMIELRDNIHPLHHAMGTVKIDGLLITGGDEPLNVFHVDDIIKQAIAANVPVWLYHNSREWLNPQKKMIIKLPIGYDSHKLWDGREYRNLPASMMGGK